MDEADYKAWALIGFSLTATLMATLKRSGALSLQEEADIYDTVLQQLEGVQAISGDQVAVVERARATIETLRRDPPPSRAGRTGPT